MSLFCALIIITISVAGCDHAVPRLARPPERKEWIERAKPLTDKPEAEVTQKLGMKELAKLFKETANQETEQAFVHFRLLHPELAIDDPGSLTEKPKKAIAARCLELAIEGETSKSQQSSKTKK